MEANAGKLIFALISLHFMLDPVQPWEFENGLLVEEMKAVVQVVVPRALFCTFETYTMLWITPWSQGIEHHLTPLITTSTIVGPLKNSEWECKLPV